MTALLSMVATRLERRWLASLVGEGTPTPAATTLPGAVRAIEANRDRLA